LPQETTRCRKLGLKARTRTACGTSCMLPETRLLRYWCRYQYAYVSIHHTFANPRPASPMSSPRQYFGINPTQLQMYMYLPYLHFDSYKAIVRRRTLIKRRIKQGRSRPVPQSVAKLDSLEVSGLPLTALSARCYSYEIFNASL